MEVKILGQ